MVGRKSFPSSKVELNDAQDGDSDLQLPPSYSDTAAPRLSQPYFTGMTTTVTTTTQTTQTTTQFFSLPLWRRRTGPPMSAAIPEASVRDGAHVNEEARIVRPVSYHFDIDKELPAVPDNFDDARSSEVHQDSNTLPRPSSSSSRDASQHTAVNSRAPSREFSSPPSYSHPTLALAQAALGLGLPHVMPLAAASSSKTDLTAVPEDRRSDARHVASGRSVPDVRRAKSFSRTRSEGYGTNSKIEDQKTRRPRTSTSAGIRESSDISIAKGKGKEKESEPEVVNSQASIKPLSRRPSFWNRRRVNSLKSPVAQTPAVMHTPVPALPFLPPVSPMFPEKYTQSSPFSPPISPTFQPPGKLRRRHSERSSSYSSTRLSPLDTNFMLEPPPIPMRSPLRLHSSLLDDTSRLTAIGGEETAESVLMPIPHNALPHPLTSSPPSRSPPLLDRNTRPRSMTGPSNILHRLSMGLFISSPPSPVSSPTVSTSVFDEKPITSSPRSSITLLRSSLSRSTTEIPKPKDDQESPAVFLSRLEEAVSKAEIANVLAGSGDAFYTRALELYIDRFNFRNDPLDIALRKLLMEIGLPKETQQIDRVMEAFASKYSKCNPGLFVSEDHPYILAFSLIMLHTDAFNKSNKRKMTKADYIKNTKLVGVSSDVLDCFFDNIVFAPFIFIEDPVDINGQRGFTQDGSLNKISRPGSSHGGPSMSSSGLSMLGKTNKIDPYYLIAQNLLGHLRVDIGSHIPLRNPFSYQGTAGSWNEGELRRSFARADVIEVDSMENRRMSTMPFFSSSVAGAPGPMLNGYALPHVPEPDTSLSEISILKVTKVGLLNRKEDLLEGGKRASNRKWKEWSMILTGSQLLFYRDSALALHLIAQSQMANTQALSPQLSLLYPDELLSLRDAIAVHDASYSKHENVFRISLRSGRQLLLQTENEQQRNEWIAHINYASSFKTAGIRMRPMPVEDAAGSKAASKTRDSGKPGQPLIDSLEMPNNTERSSCKLTQSMQYTGGTVSGVLAEPPLDHEDTSASQSRSRILRSKIREFEAKIKATQSQLDADIRLVRNLAILTPFQRSTRDRLQSAVIVVARSIKQLRLEFVKSACYRDVLVADLLSEEREMQTLQLNEHRAEEIATRSTEGVVPKMTLSIHDDINGEHSPESLSSSDLTELSAGRPASSICESFHSALDFSSDWPLNRRPSSNSISAGSEAPAEVEDSTVGAESSQSLRPSDRATANPSDDRAPSPSQPPVFESVGSGATPAPHPLSEDAVVSGQNGVEEQAEEWNRTRAAKRVSLVRVPQNLKVSKGLETLRNHAYTNSINESMISETDSAAALLH